jgi:hypothetical protein
MALSTASPTAASTALPTASPTASSTAGHTAAPMTYSITNWKSYQFIVMALPTAYC